ncbi:MULTISPECIES: nuclear transport factor 2 family protein [Nocardiopsis]|uniref:SnoaL-like domain-containing protein n=1 Tax=Nocardiopsis dassonvillei (strain ATCC 23218 / DSM 43111 / CIP 107115 / JCM 7437 / KCTC 9190 / NBRC 14626 / NCTC 10488 / NRRL B-5397 / IMRU 509) TaxID=446468 RepID=D7B7G0_NOCDD|nr:MULTISPECIES: nuclear transport factor 2 family protein [Nocardiopsis]ADH67532.1 hypothetical protein Ndas_2107 [Nocardiopsis dassonvillei subsp. dassonvillei DSM 43111]VEI87818.1 Uncharacterised protein [Nocardiopsis dassonvillei]
MNPTVHRLRRRRHRRAPGKERPLTRTHHTRPHDAELRRLLDRAEISEVQTRYATGTDSRDWELFRSCFTDEVEVDFGEGFGPPAVRLTADAWVAGTAPRTESFQAAQHMRTNHVVTFDGDDHATCMAHVRASHHLPNSLGDSDRAGEDVKRTGSPAP